MENEHDARWHEPKCKNCGSPNPNYVKPTHYCKNCRNPVKAERLNNDLPCDSCGQNAQAEEYKE